ncbi:OLC1v1014741C1 [Oldenlandia corymbosa var. corymbosa]|uniref:Regulator of telomere elongation helicase 1 homolog n=1 Tax=Oldenlandia corymbosa var. corymbosa TaxID=529605 RepID=A0AAV1E1Y9_OLDCO|nr:OLC1v1014741C1 [Oldenlandia corymbosa var. corymbosa]
MPIYNLRGINVDFPYEAYDCQLVYMEKVIESLQNKTNALLESPTGTGKTLCLLCATLAWRKSLGEFSRGRVQRSERSERNGRGGRNDDADDPEDLSQPFKGSQSSGLPTIVYTSRTHSQIRQVIQELKRTNYRPKMVVLGSREQLCIHEDVRVLRGKAQTNACHLLCKKRRKRYCSHFSRVTEYLSMNPGLGDEPIDIEDLVNIGRSSGPCPYYLSRDLHKSVDILFAPYNYLIDRGNRKTLKIAWDNSVLIFDEAHNLEGLCADAASFDLPESLLDACIAEAEDCIALSDRRDNSNDKSCKPEDFKLLKGLLRILKEKVAQIPIQSKELGFTKTGPYIYELLSELNITPDTATVLIDTIDQATILIEEGSNSTKDGERGPDKAEGTICRLESMGDILRLIFRDDNSHAKYYRVHVREVEGKSFDGLKGNKSRVLSWWCFNPGIAMEEFAKLGVASIILTSGTLSPLDSFAEELKLEFPIRLENPHVISENQIWAGVVPTGPSGYTLNSSFRSRDSLEYKQDLGNAIVNFARIVPDGLLVFFPSYYLLDRCIDCWKTVSNANSPNSCTIWERICKHKLPVVEPRQSSLFPLSIEDYMTKLKDKSASGAVFFAVCRGKVSEGLDFADHAGRAVIVTGLPFATRTDPKVRLKREFLDESARLQPSGRKVLTGEEWYSQQASRAVNQSVGRVIRHRHDYGAIIFCDERFLSSNRQSEISLWIQPHIKSYSKFGDIVFNLTRFFRNGGNCGPTKLELTRNDSQGTATILECSGSNEMSHSTKLTANLATQERCSDMSGSFTKKKDWNFDRLPKIVPANRSSLAADRLVQDMILNRSTVAISVEKNLAIPRSNSVTRNSSEITNLSDEDTELDKKCKKLFMPCTLKKPRLVSTASEQPWNLEDLHEPSSMMGNSHSISYQTGLSRKEKLTESGCQQVDQNHKRRLDGEIKAHNKTSTTGQKNKEMEARPATTDEKEKKGSEFLKQVREKLTDAEYKEFVGFMTALKSKAMKVRQVLQSIARLFSQPDRVPLLDRFKNYVPAKYHTLYEQCVQITQKNSGLGRDSSQSSR